MWFKPHHALFALAVSLPLAACSSQSTAPASKPLVTDVDHTVVKRQSIGNCWIYAQATWLESLLLTQTGEELDVSESYWTWWHWYDQIVGRDLTELQTGGHWSTSANILRRRGFVLEGEFLADEAGVEMSLRQAQAQYHIDTELQPGGALGSRELRTPERVRAELDKAFGSDMAAAQGIARSAETTIVSGDQTVAQALKGWSQVSFPRVHGKTTVVTPAVVARRDEILRRVMRALNDRKPVVMTFMVDFNAMDEEDNGTFKKSLLDINGMGSQGGHMVVLEDYTVDDVPGYGYIGEGEVSDEMKAAALQGRLLTLKSKNSWGSNRPERGLSDGYTRFEMDYLLSQLEWMRGSDPSNTSWYTTLTDFVLPPGY